MDEGPEQDDTADPPPPNLNVNVNVMSSCGVSSTIKVGYQSSYFV